MAQQTVLITGASSGIGKAAAKMLAQKGNRVFGTARHPENASDLADEAKANGWNLTLLSMDVCPSPPPSFARLLPALLPENTQSASESPLM